MNSVPGFTLRVVGLSCMLALVSSSLARAPDNPSKESHSASSSSNGGSPSGKPSGASSAEDEAITKEILQRFAEQKEAAASQLKVDAHSRTIILSGQVPDSQTRQRLGSLAQQVRGVE